MATDTERLGKLEALLRVEQELSIQSFGHTGPDGMQGVEVWVGPQGDSMTIKGIGPTLRAAIDSMEKEQ